MVQEGGLADLAWRGSPGPPETAGCRAVAPSALALGLPGFRLPSEPHSGSGTFSGPLSSYQVLKLEVLEYRNRKQHSSSAKWLAVLKKLSIRYRPTRQPCPWALDPEQVTQTPGRTQSSSTLRQIPDLGQAQMSLHREVADPAVVRPHHETLVSHVSTPGNRRLRERRRSRKVTCA